MRKLLPSLTIMVLATGCNLKFATCDNEANVFFDEDTCKETACDSPDNIYHDPEACAQAEGETGAEDYGAALWCSLHAWETHPWQFCALEDTADPAHVAAWSQTAGMYLRTSDECLSTSEPFPHVPDWSTPVDDNYSGQLDMWCGRTPPQGSQGFPDPLVGADYGHDAGSGWRLCKNNYGDNAEWLFPADYYPATGSPVSGSSWVASASCVDPEGGNGIQNAGACTRGLVAVGGHGPLDATLPVWTCECRSDSDCQLGAVCEAGWTIEDGFPTPTLCTWDDGSGTPNGIAPEGPVVYGVGNFADGVTVEGERVTFTADFADAAFSGGVLNDDHRFGLAGEFTRVGPDSLAAYLGLTEGDLVDVDQRTLDALLVGERVDVKVLHADGSGSVFNVGIE